MGSMPSFHAALRSLMPAADAVEKAYPPAFAAIADLLLNRATLMVADKPHQFTEIEFYFNGRNHRDTFTHGDVMQREFCRWYFHRTGGEYRSGTYKGLDLAFGDADVPAGILIRGVEQQAPVSALVDGPCMVVDHILALTNMQSIPALVASFDRQASAPEQGSSPLNVVLRESSAARVMYASPRVGLTLKRSNSLDRQRFIARNYRFLTEPARIKKGKIHVVVGLHRKGTSPDEIAKITGARLSVITGYIAAWEKGRGYRPEEFSSDLNTNDTCALFGACEKLLED